MEVPKGTFQLGPENGTIIARVYREGAGAKVGHDLILEALRWSATVATQEGPSQVDATVDAGSLVVREGTGGVKPLTDKDRKDIQARMKDQVLHVDQYPEIKFHSTEIGGEGGQLDVRGDLSLAGSTQPVAFPVTVERSNGSVRLRGTATIKQTLWGIKLYRAFLGALKVKDDVEVEFDVRVEQS